MTQRAVFAFFALLFARAVAPVPALAGEPARYLVFALDENGAPRPQSHRRVELPDGSLAPAKEGAGAAAGREVWRWRLEDAGGAQVFAGRVRVPRFFSAEKGLFGDGGAEELLPAQRAFVVRVPWLAGSRLALAPADFDGAAAAAGEFVFDLDALEADPALPLAGLVAAAQPRISAKGSGDSGNRFDLLLMGDGYTAAEQGKFENDAGQLANGFFGLTPYAEYRGFIKTATLFTPSGQSGADHPPFSSGCGASYFQSCCADADMQADPLAGRFVDTAFNATFCSFNTHRLLVVDASRVLTAAGAYPEWDRILVLVNDGTYGGAGGSLVGSLSTHPAVVELAQHEFGHTFTDLADEYSSPYPGFPSCSDRFGPACEPNVTDETRRDRVKWGPWIAGATPLPTSGGDPATVGLFEGARYLDAGMYRPQQSCLMNTLGFGFCKVCAQAFVLALYRGGWGDPAGGIDYLESLSPSPGTYSLALPATRAFSAGLLQPLGNTIEAVWKVNGEEAGRGDSFTFAPQSAGSYEVRLETRDRTPLVHPAMAGSLLEKTRTWTVNVTGAIVHEPTLAAIAPATGPATGGTLVTLTGSNFTAGATVKIGGAAATEVTVASPTRITGKTPPGAAGKADVLVTTADGSARLDDAFTYGSTTPCVPAADRLCLGQGRFAVEVGWRTAVPASGAGNATVIPGSPDSGLFWFFSENNQEMLVKVLDGCAINQRYWVFYAATTNVGFEVSVTDTRSGSVRTYGNVLGTPAPPVQDIEAFATCP